MTPKQSVRREKFETDTFPHLDALWETALWLTMHGSLAENLVLKTMTRAYREWQDPGELAGSKVRLFRIFTREFFGFGKQKEQWHQSAPFHSENTRATAGSRSGNPQNTMTAITQSQLQWLAGISGMAVKGTIARLRPHARLMLILLYRERFSYADIVYITDHSEETIRAMLSRLRKVIPGYILQTAIGLKEVSDNQLPVKKNDSHSSV